MIVGDMEIRLRADIARLQRDMDSARRVVGDATAAMGRAADVAKAALAGIGIGVSLSHIAQLSDEYSKFTAQLRLSADGAKAYAQAYADVKRIATSSQSDLAATGSLYAQITRATSELGVSQKAVADITESVNLALKISGAGAQESSGAILQLSQAFASGVLRGDEFNSVNEAAPRLMRALADSIGAPVGSLRDMAAQGKLTADLIAKSLPGALSQLRNEGAEIQTISGAFAVLKNNVMEFTGVQAQASGAVTVATSVISGLANNLTLVAGAAATVAAAKLGAWLDNAAVKAMDGVAANRALAASSIATAEANATATAQASLLANARLAEVRAATLAASGETQLALTTNALIPAQARATAAAEAHALAMGQLSVAQRAASLSTTAASGVMAALGGPIGLLIVGLGLAATAWTWYKEKQDEATAESAEKVGQLTSDIIGNLEKQNAKLRERIELSKKAGLADAAKQGGASVDRMAELLKQIDEMKAKRTRLSPGDQVALIEYQAQYDALERVVKAAGELKKVLDASGKAASDLRQQITGVSDSYVTDLAKLKKGLDDGLISQTDYIAAVKRLATETFNGSQAGKDLAKSIDLSTDAIRRRVEVQDLMNQRDQEHIQFLKGTGQIDDEAALRQTAASQLKDLSDQKKGLQDLLALAGRKADNQKEQADLAGQIAVINTRVKNRQKQEEEDLFKLEQDRYRQAVGNSADVIEKEQAELASLRQQTQAQIDYNEQIGLSAKQIAVLTAARLEEAAARKDAESIIAEGLDLTGERAQRIRDEAAALRERGAAVVAGADKQELFDKNLQDLNAMVDIMSALDEAAQSAAQGMASAFGSVGQAIGGMTTALTGFERTQAAIAAQLAGSLKDAHGDPMKIQRANQMAAEASAQAQIKSYGDMAGAAKGFFDEQSKGYAILNGVEKAYRAAEMVMALESMTKKIFFKETEVAANTTLSATKIAGEAAATSASIGLAATESSAWGITAVVKAIASMPFPLNLAAGAATLAAVVGIGAKIVGSVGGSGVSLSQQRQQDQGAGSVLGDSSAKSESIKKALDAIEKNTYQGLAINSNMLATLRSIDTNISSFASQLVRTTDISNPDIALKSGVSGANMGSVALASAGFAAGSMVTLIGGVMGPIGALAGLALSRIPVVQKLMTSIFGGKQSVEDSGFGMDATSLASILGNGAHAYQYADIKTSGGWFSSGKTSVQSNPLGDAANQQFTAIIQSLAGSVKTAGELLGLSGDEFTNKLNSFVIDIGKVSLKGLKGDDLQKAVESIFSKLGDDMARFAVGGLQDFQQVGEGYLETLARIASEYQTIDVVFQSFGKTFGEVGLASVGARDRLVQLAGGLDKFTSQGEYFLTNFFSEQEQAAALRARIDPTLAQYGLKSSGEDADKMFRNFIVGLDTTTEEGAKTYTTLMMIAPALKQVLDSEKSVLDERKGLQDQLDEMTMSSAQLLAKQRDALDESNRALFDQVQAIKSAKDSASSMLAGVGDAYSALQKVVAREKSVLQTSVDSHTAAFNKLQSLSQALHSTLDSLKSPDQKAFERAAAQAQIRAALAIAKAGGPLPDSDSLKNALSAVTQDASSQFSSYADYMRDLLQTQSDVAALAGLTDDSLSVEQRSLDALKDQLARLDDIVANGQAQLDALNGQSVATLSLAQAMAAFKSSTIAAQANPVVSGTSVIAGYYQDLLGRAPDQEGLKYWQDVLASGASLENIRNVFMGSDEYKKLHPFAVGTNFVPETMPALVHQGERIIPAADNRVLMSVLARAGSGDSDALVAEIRALRTEIAELKNAAGRTADATERTAGSTGQMAEQIDNVTDGGNAMRADVFGVVRTKEVA